MNEISTPAHLRLCSDTVQHVEPENNSDEGSYCRKLSPVRWQDWFLRFVTYEILEIWIHVIGTLKCCSFKGEMLSRDIDNLFHSWYVFQHLKKCHMGKKLNKKLNKKLDFNWRGHLNFELIKPKARLITLNLRVRKCLVLPPKALFRNQ